MEELDLRKLKDDFVIHYGGELHHVNTYTFANSLLSLSDTIRLVNTLVNPGHDIELAVEALGIGSFRAQIKTVSKSLNELFSTESVRQIILALVAAYIFQCLHHPEKPVIIVNSEDVVIEYSNQKIIIPRNANEYYQQLENAPGVKRNIEKTFSVLEKDESIQAFGITKNINDDQPLVSILRNSFPLLAGRPEEENETNEFVEITKVQIIRAILERNNRLWQFLWNGIKISAPLLDNEFYSDFFAHRITIAPGDILEVHLKVIQKKDPETELYVNSGYEVLKVLRHIPQVKQLSI